MDNITIDIYNKNAAKYADLDLKIVGFPSHVIVKYEEEMILDPFNRGRLLELEDLQEILYQNYGDSVEFQADYLKDFYTLAFSHPSVSSITFWNLTDKNAWRGHAGGLLFEDLKPKKAFNELKKLIKTTWTTKIFESNLDLKKGMDFNGFYGKYEGEIIIENKKYPFEFHHSPEQKDKVTESGPRVPGDLRFSLVFRSCLLFFLDFS